MVLLQDSIDSSLGTVLGEPTVAKHKTLTPATVLSWLPHSATPAQQDSAIQAHFKPSEIRWSKRPDTLHLPGHDKGKSLLDVQLPQYYREGFFSKDTLFHPELPGGRTGVAGAPVPYSIHNDSIITSILLAVFILLVVAFANTSEFMARQFRTFFYMPHEGSSEIAETGTELRIQLFLLLLSSLMLALLYYFYTIYYVGDSFMVPSEYHLIAIYLATMIGYFMVKGLLYTLVNIVFFSSKKNRQWIKTKLFISSMEGVMLLPAVLLQAYFGMSERSVIIYFIFVLFFVKILTFFKGYVVFFRSNVVKLQIILYFCALEIVPLLAFWGALDFVANSLKIIF